MRANKISQRGFTLVELAVVLLIIGLMTGGAMFGLTAMRENARLKETNTSLREIENALTLHVIRHGRLPWADTNHNGAEDATAAEGVVPWNDLGLRQADVIDGWGNYLRYRVDPAFADVDNDLVCLRNPAALQNNFQRTGALVLRDLAGGATNVAYVLVSHGTNGLGATNGGGGLNQAPNSVNEQENTDSDSDFRAEGQAADGEFDDLTAGRGAGQILHDTGCRQVSDLPDNGSGGGGGGSGGGGNGGGLRPGSEDLDSAVAISDLGAGNVTNGKDDVVTTSDGTDVSAPGGGQVHVGHKGQASNTRGVGNSNSGLKKSLRFEFSCPRSAYSIKFLDFEGDDQATIVGIIGGADAGTHVACASDSAGCDAFDSTKIASGPFKDDYMGEFVGRFADDFDTLEVSASAGSFWVHELRTQKTDACSDDNGGANGGDSGGGGATGQCVGKNNKSQTECGALEQAACISEKKCEWQGS